MNSKSPLLPMRQRILRPALWLAGCVLWLGSDPLGTLLQAQEEIERPKAVDLLPERTALYIQIDNVRDLVQDFKDSNFGRMLQDERIAPFVEQLYGEAKSAVDQLMEDEEVGFSVGDLMSLPAGEVCFAVITPRRDTPKFALIMDVPEDSDVAQRLIDRAREQARDEAEFDEGSVENIPYQIIRGNGDDETVYYLLHEGTLVGCNDQEVFEELMTRWLGEPPEDDRTLAGNRKFVTIMNKCKSTEELPMSFSIFCDPIMLARSATMKEPEAKLVFAALPTLGLDGVSAVGGAALFNEKNYESVFHGHLLLTNPRAGILEMIALRPGFYDPELFVPEDTVTYATSSWDFRKFLSELEKIVDTFMGDGAFQKQIDENINEQLNINFQEDVLENLAGRVSFIQWNSETPTLDGQCNGMSVQINDPAAAREFMESVLDRIEEEEGDNALPVEAEHKGITFWHAPSSFEEMGRQARQRWRDRREEQGEDLPTDDNEGRTQLQLNETQPCWALIEDNFVLTGNIKFMEHLIETFDGEHNRLTDNEEFKSTMQEIRTLMDGNLPSMLSYSRPDQSLKIFYDLLETDNTRDFLKDRYDDNPFFSILSDLLEENELPPFEDLAGYFPPQGSFVVNDETGFHFLAFQRRAQVDEDD